MKVFILLAWLLLGLAPSQFLAQTLPTAEVLLENAKNYYQMAGDYSVEATYSMFRGKTNNNLLEKQQMITYKRGNSFYTKMGPMEYLVTQNQVVKINHLQKAMEYTANTSGQGWESSFLDVTQYLNQFATKEVTKTANNYILQLSTPLLTQLPYTTIVLSFDKETFSLVKQELTLAGNIAYKDPKGKERYDLKRLVIDITSFTTSFPKSIKKTMNISAYVNTTTRDVRPNGDFLGYTLIDRTIN